MELTIAQQKIVDVMNNDFMNVDDIKTKSNTKMKSTVSRVLNELQRKNVVMMNDAGLWSLYRETNDVENDDVDDDVITTIEIARMHNLNPKSLRAAVRRKCDNVKQFLVDENVLHVFRKCDDAIACVAGLMKKSCE